MPNRTPPTWQLLDIAAGGRARELLARCRREQMTYDQIAVVVAADYGLTVSREWVRLNCVRLGIGSKGVAA